MERGVYYTRENARRIDYYRHYINTIPDKYRDFILAPLLVEASKHNNCSGHFAAYYKKDGIGHFGGKKDTDIKRITQNIELPMPYFLIINAICLFHKKILIHGFAIYQN